MPNLFKNLFRIFLLGFVDFDDYEAVDLVVSQREHFIGGHRMRVELALPMINDSLYEKDVVATQGGY
jgi:hypothetical protein